MRGYMEKISFIIPAHNAGETIERTISSITRLKINSEILVVENGSTDNTVKIISDITKKFDNVSTFTSELGVSKARNKGIGQATGDWIVFVDADDECLSGIESILKIATEQKADKRERLSSNLINTPDLIIASYTKDNDTIVHDYRKINTVLKSTDEMKAWMISRPTLRMQAWAKIYRTKFLKGNQLLFNDELAYSEDSEFVIRVLQKAQRVLISDVLIYQYHSGTVSATRGFVDGRISAYIRALEVAETDIEGECQVVKNAFSDYVIAHINIIGVHDIFGCEIKEAMMDRCRKMRQLLKEGVIERAMNKANVCFSIQTLPVVLCKHRLTIWGGVIYYVRSLQNKERYRKASFNNNTSL